MNMKTEKEKLKDLIQSYLEKKSTCEDLNRYAWEKIDYFSSNENKIPPYDEENEGEYWYAIWQIQHLADSEHEKDGILQAELSNIMEYFEKKKPLPRNFYGKRP